jgi:hypothetical protein
MVDIESGYMVEGWYGDEMVVLVYTTCPSCNIDACMECFTDGVCNECHTIRQMEAGLRMPTMM